jgi:arylsulfatase A-like enzyme
MKKSFLLYALLAATPLVHAADPINFIVIFTDDQGYNDIGVFGAPKIKTPHLDRMAKEGMRFTDFYSASPVCSTSRAALLTGRYPYRNGVRTVLFPNRDTQGLHPYEVTVAEVLKEAGYATAAVGKWHVGHADRFLPTNQGFDSYYGIPYSNDMWIAPDLKISAAVKLNQGYTLEKLKADQAKKRGPRNLVPVMRNVEVVEYPADQTQLTRNYTEESLAFIRANRGKPFFLYLAHTMPHIPLFASEAFKGKSAGGPYGDTIEEIDWSVGQVLDTLKALDLDRKTLVIFTSDNGPWKLSGGRGGSAFPLKGYKFSTHEGGQREPTIMWGPGHIPAGTVCKEVAGTIDLMPTLAAWAGAKMPGDRVIDGRDIGPLMRGDKGARSPHKAYFYIKAGGLNVEAVRVGDFKYTKQKALYNLREDISEKTNIREAHPEKAEEMQKLITAFVAEVKADVEARNRIIQAADKK